MLAPATALGADPEEAHYNVVVSLYNAGQWQAAITKIQEREKLELPPEMKARYLYARGLALEKGNKAADARAAFEDVVAKYPAAPETQSARVSILYMDYAKGDAAAVVKGYAAVDQAKLTPANKKNLALMFAESLYAQKDDKGSLAAYKAAIAAGADAAPLAPKLFDLSLRLGMHADLIAQSANGVVGVAPDVVALTRTEALLALGRFAEAEAEAQKVPANSPLAARASFARGQSLIKLNRLKDAAAPLKIAVAGLKDPPAPPAAHVALAECLLENGAQAEAGKALDDAERAIRQLPPADQQRLLSQVSLIRLRTVATGDRKKIIKAVEEGRATLPPDQLPKALYMRLFALSEEGDRKGILATMKDDFPILQAGENDGPSTMIYYDALKQTGKGDDAGKLLDEFLKRRPAANEASRARLLLASAALERGDQAQARTAYDALAADAKAPAALGKNAFDEAMFNRAVLLQKLNDNAAAAKAFAALVAAKPDAELLRKTLPLLGQSYALQKDYPNAAAAWKQALAGGKVEDEGDLRDRLARVLLAANDFAGVAEQCAAAATLAGSENKLARPLREMWARALFSANKFPDAAARYEALYKSFSDSPGYAYETAAAYDKANDRASAAKWYAVARENKAKLPAAYAAAVDANLAGAQLQSGAGDSGLGLYLDQMAAAKDEAAFDAAAASVRRIAAGKPLDAKAAKRVAAMLETTPPEQARRYTLGAMVLQAQLAAGQHKEAAALAAKLAEDFTKAEMKLDPKASGATLAPAIIYFCQGEALRVSERYTDAMVAYETVLSAYPYNEWPDAAACGEAECFAALGEKEAAVKKFQEVLAAPVSPASAPWRERATNRIAELNKPEPAKPEPSKK
ncbi:MAG: tetratricopeptide repeat protein [Planctomycetota bacterium]|nr:tetratricopeptide repeat protein [Planctomycetota bacterium]